MSLEDFTTAVNQTSLRDNMVNATYNVLVRGLTYSDAARIENRSRQEVHRSVRRVNAAHEKIMRDRQLIKQIVWIPPESVHRIRELERLLRLEKRHGD